MTYRMRVATLQILERETMKKWFAIGLLFLPSVILLGASAVVAAKDKKPDTPKVEAPALPPPANTPGPVVKPKDPYDSTKAQLAWTKRKLYVSQYQQILATMPAIQALQHQDSEQAKFLDDWMKQVRKDNGWDDTYVYDPEQDHWVHAEKPAEKKPDDKK